METTQPFSRAEQIRDRQNIFVDVHGAMIPDFIKTHFDFDPNVKIRPYSYDLRMTPAFPSKLFAYLYNNCFTYGDRARGVPTSLISRVIRATHPTALIKQLDKKRTSHIIGLHPKPDSEFVKYELSQLLEGEQSAEKYQLATLFTEWEARERQRARWIELTKKVAERKN